MDDALLFIGEQHDLNRMTTTPYYPPRPNQISIMEKVLFSIMVFSIAIPFLFVFLVFSSRNCCLRIHHQNLIVCQTIEMVNK